MHALLFPGQGAQKPGMGAPWVDTPSWSVVSRLAAESGRDIAALLLEADAETLQATRHAQLATFSLSLVALDALRAAGLERRAGELAFAGHSLGEYTALVAAGALAEGPAVRLVAERGEAMQEAADAAPGTMAAVLGLPSDQVEDLVGPVADCWVANDNAPGQVVVSGRPEAVAAVGEAARSAGGKVMPLAVGGAFHTPLMAAAATRLEAALAVTDFAEPSGPVVANVDGEAHRDADGWRSRLAAQLCRPVRWRTGLVALDGLGVDTFVEVGPGTALTGMVKRTLAGARRLSVGVPADLAAWADPAAGGGTDGGDGGGA